MILGFRTTDKSGNKTGFVEKILDGKKVHSIRNGTRWRTGMSIQFATGVRTKIYKQFKIGTCSSVQSIKIRPSMDMSQSKVFIDGRELSVLEKQKLAWNDGFHNLVGFWLWFTEDVDGQLIHWSDLKY